MLTSYFQMLFSAAITCAEFTSPPLFPIASLLFSSNSNKSACTLKEERHLHGPPTANLWSLIEFYDLRRQCATELSVVAADNQIYGF